MTAVAIIVEYQTPDLLTLCLASLRRFAPSVIPRVVIGSWWGEGARAHAAGIEHARNTNMAGDAETVILLDTDVVILSDAWLPYIYKQLSLGAATGGLRHRGDVTQLYCQGKLLLHAHCLAMTRELFQATPHFSANGILDTAYLVTLTAQAFGGTTAIIPQSGEGWPSRVGLYAEGSILWAHLGRGTSFRPRGPWRERLRRVAARVGSPRARKILSYQQDRQAFLRKGWEIVRG